MMVGQVTNVISSTKDYGYQRLGMGLGSTSLFEKCGRQWKLPDPCSSANLKVATASPRIMKYNAEIQKIKFTNKSSILQLTIT
uniref:Uncharacterized protein n=1 Tax=Romanomermis culicivorax TaxID=13658 RepID=A0A915IJR6_ROMCU